VVVVRQVPGISVERALSTGGLKIMDFPGELDDEILPVTDRRHG
jgi:hypothetical protein